MPGKWDTELAKLFKERENKALIGSVVGKVVSAAPDLQVSIIDGNILLYKEQLYCCDHVVSGYTRQYTTEVAAGTIELTDTLKTGDDVLLIHTADEQTWFIIDRITKL